MRRATRSWRGRATRAELPPSTTRSFGASAETHSAGTRRSPRVEPASEKQCPRSSSAGATSTAARPSSIVSGERPRATTPSKAWLGGTPR